MILTCPDCATRYFVEDSRLGPEGRTVRCAACGSSWRALAEAPLELTASAEEGALAREAPLSFRPDEPPAVTAPELPKVFRAKAQQRRRLKEAAAAGAVWAGMVSAFAAVLVAAFVFRVEVVKLYPRAAGAYALARVPVNPTGLEFEGVKAEPAPAGLTAVLVSGSVRNVEDRPTPPPPLRVSLLDTKGRKLATRVVHLDSAPLAPGKTMAFSASLPNPKGIADDVAVEFALDLQSRASSPAPKARQSAPSQSKPAPAKRSAPAPATERPLTAAPALRPAMDLPSPRPVEAKPLPANDPYALHPAPSSSVSSPHG